MKALMLVTALAAGVCLAAAPADAAKKRKSVAAPRAAVAPEAHVVRDSDGEILGQDPDPFIRLMIRREGRIRDQTDP